MIAVTLLAILEKIRISGNRIWSPTSSVLIHPPIFIQTLKDIRSINRVKLIVVNHRFHKVLKKFGAASIYYTISRFKIIIFFLVCIKFLKQILHVGDGEIEYCFLIVDIEGCFILGAFELDSLEKGLFFSLCLIP